MESKRQQAIVNGTVTLLNWTAFANMDFLMITQNSKVGRMILCSGESTKALLGGEDVFHDALALHLHSLKASDKKLLVSLSLVDQERATFTGVVDQVLKLWN
jgi:hypothetical protein